MSAVNTADLQLEAGPHARIVAVALPSNQTVDFGQVNGGTKPSNNADVTSTAINNTVVVTGGGITLSAGGAIKGGQTAFDTGTGFFLGFSGGAYKFSIGDSAGHKITFDGSSLDIVADITGVSSISLTGSAQFDGATTSSGVTYAGVFNFSGASTNGLIGITTSGKGIFGFASTGVGGYGQTTSGVGFHGIAVGNGVGVRAECNPALVPGTALEVLGRMTINDTTLVSNLNSNFLQGNSASAFLGVGATAANSSLLQGNAASAFLGVGATAADSSSLGGFGSGSWIRQTGIAAGSPGTAFTHTLSCVSGGVNFRMGVFVP